MLEKVKRPPQQDYLPFSEIFEHPKPQQHAVELTDVAQLMQTLLDMAVDSGIDPDMVRNSPIRFWLPELRRLATSSVPQ